MYRRYRLLAVVSLSLLLSVSQGRAQGPKQGPQGGPNINWQYGPCTADISGIAQVKVPEGYKFSGVEGTRALLEFTQNIPTPRDLGVLCPNHWPGRDAWFLVFEWDGIGYVKDDEKNNLNADAIMQSMRNAQNADNQQRQAKGWPTLEMVGWEMPPFYDPQTNNLTWATRIRDNHPAGPMEAVNYNSRLLGRGGVMSANLVISPELLPGTLPKYKEIVDGFTYLPGQKYSEWRSGDKMAAYGLTALVAGGGAAILAKSGWLAKFGKVIIVGGVAVIAGIGALFKKLFGRGENA